VLRLEGTMKPAANISLQNVSRFTGMVEMRGVHFSAVIGGRYDASALPQVNGSRGWCAVRWIPKLFRRVRGWLD
jgi:hypothetical protein